MPFPYVFTFYSYKGGVGGSMALLNTGYLLASYGRHVLMVFGTREKRPVCARQK